MAERTGPKREPKEQFIAYVEVDPWEEEQAEKERVAEERRQYFSELAGGYLGANDKDRESFRTGFSASLREQHGDDRHAIMKDLESFDSAIGYHDYREELSEEADSKIMSEVDDYVKEEARSLVRPEDYREVGKAIRAESGRGRWEVSKITDIPHKVVDVVVDEYEEAGVVASSKYGNLRATAKASGEIIDLYTINNAKEARRVVDESLDRAMATKDKGLSEIYAERRKTEMDKVKLTLEGPSEKRLFASDLLVGHQDSAVDFYEKTIDDIKALPEEMQPDVVVMSGIMQGNHQLRDKRKQAILVDGLRTLDDQYKHAKGVLDKTAELGVPIIYNMSDEDRRIAEQETIFRIKELTKDSKIYDLEGKIAHQTARLRANDTTSPNITYYQEDQIKQNPIYNEHLQFNIDVVFPYCLKSGRNLKRGGEYSADADQMLPMDEYYALYHTYQDLVDGREPDPRYASLVNLDNIRIPGEQSGDLMITDDVEVTTKTDERTYVDHIRHSMQFGRTPVYGEHMKNALNAYAQAQANGDETPNSIILQGNGEGVSTILPGNALALSTTGLIRARNILSSSGTRLETQDQAQRQMATRRRLSSPGMEQVERTDDGRIIYTIYNEKLMAKSDSLDERVSLAVICDWQTGSPTARPEYQVKYLDYLRTRTLGENAMRIVFAGDNIHGRNYPDFPNEGQFVGLISMDSQQEFLTEMIERELENYGPEQIKGLEKVLLQIGNHEWNSGTYKWHGDSFIQYLKKTYEGLYRRNGDSYDEAREKVTFHNAMATTEGDYLRTYSTIDKVGDYGFISQHYAMDRGAKGSTGGLPVYQAFSQSNGTPELFDGIDVKITGHWHHPQRLMEGDKIAVVNGSLAGLSGYEFMRGYNPVKGSAIVHLGGGLPPQIEFVTEEALINHKIKDGYYSDAQIEERKGYRDDENFDPRRHGIHMPDRYPKSALQKEILDMERRASQYDSTHGIIGRDK